MEGKTILTLLGVVCVVALSWGDVNAPMEEKREIATPEVVLQLKYEQGALNRIYLTQFRPEGSTSVPAATQLCSDLCHAGLGGESCGATCTDMMPVGLATALRTQNHSSTQFGQPRVRVCPTLCANQLGTPLCKCPQQAQVSDHPTSAVDWDAVCDVFCLNDGYVLGGCPVCKKISIPPITAAFSSSRLLDTSEGWVSWCNVQCRQGHGGAACNCDRAPFQ